MGTILEKRRARSEYLYAFLPKVIFSVELMLAKYYGINPKPG
jgi:hypothetical protein